MLSKFKGVNPFSTDVPLLYPLKTSENQRFSDAFREYESETLVKNESFNFYSPWNYQKRFSEDSGENKIRLILEVEFDDDRQQFWVGWSETEMLNTEWETEKDKSDDEHKIISKNRLKGKKRFFHR